MIQIEILIEPISHRDAKILRQVFDSDLSTVGSITFEFQSMYPFKILWYKLREKTQLSKDASLLLLIEFRHEIDKHL